MVKITVIGCTSVITTSGWSIRLHDVSGIHQPQPHPAGDRRRDMAEGDLHLVVLHDAFIELDRSLVLQHDLFLIVERLLGNPVFRHASR